MLAVARLALGALLVVRTTALANAVPIPLAHVRGPLLGWPDHGMAFAWGGLVLPAPMREIAAILRTVAAVLFLAGVRARAAGLVAGGLGLVALWQDPFGFVFTLHVLFLGTIAVALGDGTRDLALSPDREASPLSDAGSSASLLRVVVASVYAWSAIAKMNTAWLGGDTLHALAEDGLVTPFARALLAHGALERAGAWAVLCAEVALAAAVASARYRRATLLAALGFHVILEVATRPDVMGFVMGALLVGGLGLPRSDLRARRTGDPTR
jgi:hypothetical protein